MHKITLFEEYRLIERCESEVNGAWKGAHLLLFFLAFVFGSFCTFCFHMLMYLFDDKCVLFPKLISLNSIRHNSIFDFLPSEKDTNEMFPVDFLSTQWVDKTVCYLPTYVPLVSGIFGLVWTTMFLMCSTGSRTLTGLQRPWRVLPPVFIFSLAMGGLCFYTSAVTHYGLQELCVKLGEFTGTTTCTYTINVATLAYERRIRGVYQATRLTILSAWLHTTCWLMSALLALLRVLMAVDFQLVKINVQLTGDLDKMLERHERQVRTISPVVWFNKMEESNTSLHLDPTNRQLDYRTQENETANHSELSLVPEERERLARSTIYQSVPSNRKFIVNILYNLLDTMDLPERTLKKNTLSTSTSASDQSTSSKSQNVKTYQPTYKEKRAQEFNEVAMETKRNLQERLNKRLLELPRSTSPSRSVSPSLLRIVRTPPVIKQNKENKKSNLKHAGVQTDKKAKSRKGGPRKVQISEFKGTADDSSSGSVPEEVDKETQTKAKDKQD